VPEGRRDPGPELAADVELHAGSVRATIRTENVSTSILSTPITLGGSSITLRSPSST
jgi:hypothetical protein